MSKWRMGLPRLPVTWFLNIEGFAHPQFLSLAGVTKR